MDATQAHHNHSTQILEMRLEQRSTCVQKRKKTAQHILNLASVDGHNGAVAEHLALRLPVHRREDKRVLVRPYTHGTLLNPHPVMIRKKHINKRTQPYTTSNNNKKKHKKQRRL